MFLIKTNTWFKALSHIKWPKQMLLNSHFYFLFQLSILKSKEYLNNSNQNKLVYNLLLIKLVMVCDSQN